MDGSATATMLTSSRLMNPAVRVTHSARQRRGSGVQSSGDAASRRSGASSASGPARRSSVALIVARATPEVRPSRRGHGDVTERTTGLAGWRRSRTRPSEVLVTAPQRPDVDPYDGPPPADLVVEDITTGDGREAVSGQTVSVHYVGVAHSTGEEFDASWNRGAPFRFPLGAGRVIGGWGHGVGGLKVGGRGKPVLPP